MSQQATKDTGSFPISLIDSHLYGLPSEGRGDFPISEIRGGVLKCKGGVQQEIKRAVPGKDHSIPGGFISLRHFPPLQDVIGFHQVAARPQFSDYLLLLLNFLTKVWVASTAATQRTCV